MTALVLFEHRGLRGAVPAAQAAGVDAVDASAQCPSVDLWDGEVPRGRALRMQAASGLVSVRCEEVRLLEVARSDLFVLSPCLRGTLGDLPHVVGVVWLKQGATWLVDMSRFGRRAA